MTILGLGIDIVELVRIEGLLARHEKRFLERLCRDGEWQRRHAEAFVQHIGGLFASKEAVLKALGTGWSEGLAPRQVEVLRGENGAPSVRLHDVAALRAQKLGVSEVHLSVTHERSYAAAVAILEGPRYDSEQS